MFKSQSPNFLGLQNAAGGCQIRVDNTDRPLGNKGFKVASQINIFAGTGRSGQGSCNSSPLIRELPRNEVLKPS